MIPITDLIGKGKKQITMDQVPARKVCDYCCADSDIALRLSETPRKGSCASRRCTTSSRRSRCRSSRCSRRWNSRASASTWPPCAPCRNGSSRKWRSSKSRFTRRPARSSTSARRSNWRRSSSRNCACRAAARPAPEAPPTATCSSSSPSGIACPRLVLEYRQLSKLKSTYADALPEMVAPGTNRLHTSFNQAATAHRPAQQQRPEPAEHPDPHRSRRAHPQGLRRGRPAQPAADGRLLADRAAHPRAPQRRRGAARGVRAGRGHPSLRRGADPRRQARRGHARDAARGQDDEFRHHLRPGPVRPGAPVENPERGSRRLHRGVLPALSGRQGVHRAHHRGSAEERLRDHAPRPPPAAARA